MSTGRIKLSAGMEVAPTRGGVQATTIPLGFDIPGLDITGCTKNYAIGITNLQNATPATLDMATGDVTENGATAVDEGVDHEGRDLGAITSIRMIAVVAPSTNEGSVTISSNPLSTTLPPGGFAIAALPGGLGGSYLSGHITFAPDENGDAVKVYSWNA